MLFLVVVVVVNSLRPEASSLKGIYTLFALSIAYIVVIVSILKGKAVPAATTSLVHTLFLERFLFVVVVYSPKVITHPSADTGPLTRPFSM